MSPIAVRPTRPLRVRLPAQPQPPRPNGNGGRVLGVREDAVIFVLAYVVYALVGIHTLLDLKIVVGDAEARLAHAYFVWWDVPSKLTAIGFYWPPLETIVLLPLALVRPFGPSLAALPLTSAFFGAGLLVVVTRSLSLVGIDRALRWALVAALGLNPMMLYYASNGMAEIVYLFFLTLATALFVRWTEAPRWQDLPLAGFAFAFGVLTRYEVAVWIPIVLFGAVVVLMRRRASVPAVESAVLAVVVPVIYGLLLWIYVNLTITGHAFGFVTQVAPSAGPADPNFSGTLTALRDVLVLHTALFPPAFVVAAILLVVAVRTRDWIALCLAAILLANAATTFLLLLRSGQGFLLEPRYQMRSIPLTVIAIGWLLWRLPPARRRVAAIAALALLVAAAPATAATMLTYERTLDARITGNRVRPASGVEQFVRGVLLGQRTQTLVGSGSGIDDQHAIVNYIKAHVHGKNAILTDEATTFGVMLLDGHPSRYLDRIDIGDRRWLQVLNDPVGHVQYLLVNKATFLFDLVNAHYPMLSGNEKPPRFLRRVYSNPSFVVYRVQPEPTIGFAPVQ